MTEENQKKKIYIIAGEQSGDILGARLMTALTAKHDDYEFLGVGGSEMKAQGLESLFPMQDLSVMGITEILPRLPLIMRRIKQTATHIMREQPDIVITIDSPDFSFRVVKKLHERMNLKDFPKLVHYVAPTVWAWRPERARKVADLYDGVMCLYPMEPAYFENEGMKAAFVGHPAIESYNKSSAGHALRQELEIPENAKVMGLLFGSRTGELNRIGPILRQAAFQYAKQNEVHIIAPTLPHLRNHVRNLLESMPCETHIIDDQSRKWDAFNAMDFAMATSGTVGLELAIADVPHVIGYKVNALTHYILKRKVNVGYAHLANILLDKPVIHEALQKDCTPDNLLEALSALEDKADSQRASFERVRHMLYGTDESQSPSVQAAYFIESFRQ